MSPLIQALIAAAVPALTALIGYLAYLRNRTTISDEERAALIALLMGLAQNKILTLGMKYIDRGWVTKDEYQDLQRYLYTPYLKLGGNGTAERIMHAVERLPFRGEDHELLETAWRNIRIRESDPTGFPAPDTPEYNGPERRRGYKGYTGPERRAKSRGRTYFTSPGEQNV
jgi:hypothetical protein